MGSLVCHAQYVSFVMFDFEVLVFEGRTVDGLAAGAILVDEVATLGHEAFDHSVEDGAFVPEAFLMGG